jgi:hypothetical protein
MPFVFYTFVYYVYLPFDWTCYISMPSCSKKVWLRGVSWILRGHERGWVVKKRCTELARMGVPILFQRKNSHGVQYLNQATHA